MLKLQLKKVYFTINIYVKIAFLYSCDFFCIHKIQILNYLVFTIKNRFFKKANILQK